VVEVMELALALLGDKLRSGPRLRMDQSSAVINHHQSQGRSYDGELEKKKHPTCQKTNPSMYSHSEQPSTSPQRNYSNHPTSPIHQVHALAIRAQPFESSSNPNKTNACKYSQYNSERIEKKRTSPCKTPNLNQGNPARTDRKKQYGKRKGKSRRRSAVGSLRTESNTYKYTLLE